MTPVDPPRAFTDQGYWISDSPAEHRQKPEPSRKELAREMAGIYPWYLKACQRWKLEVEGLCGMTPDQIADFIVAFVAGKTPVKPCEEIPLVFTLKNAIGDLKRFYAEGYLEQSGNSRTSEEEIAWWFWHETLAGFLLLKLNDICRSSPDRMLNVIGERAIMAGGNIRRY